MAEVEIEARGLRCPWPALRLARALRDPAVRAVTIVADDANAARELEAVAAAASAHFAMTGENRFRIVR